MRLRALVSSSVVLVSLVGCSSKESSTVATGGRISPTYLGPAETAYCSSVQVHSSPVAVSGVAQYKRRVVTGSGLSSAAAATAHPIRLAEVRVTDPSGGVVQCGQTDASGNFTVNLPQGAVDYTISVNSRAYNSSYRVSILNRPEANQFYSLTATANPSASSPINVGTLTAEVTGDVLGAAFNMLDQVYAANAYLRTNVGTCPFSSCRDVTLANPIDKVSVYWEKGYNPNGYFGSTSGLSFYLPDYSRIFILGGVNGDVDTSDTDHFDNSVIIHEYGHFLEDSVFESDSPGGSHSGNSVIDPRLAWSEGWGNFFQAAVLNDPHYYDTIGNANGSTALAFAVDIEEVTNNSPTKDNPLLNAAGEAGEGNFREFTVARLLWDAIDTVQETISPGSVADNRSSEFDEIWATLTKTVNGFRDADFAYRNVGHVHLAQVKMQTSEAASDWTAIRAGNRHEANTSEYAQYLESGACADFVLDPQSGDTSTSLSGSHLFRNNDFYHVKASAGLHTVTLEYNDADGLGTEGDLDLFVYNENARFGSTSDMMGYSRNDPDGATAPGSWNPATPETESVSGTVAAGVYLINVQAYTNASSPTYTAAGNQSYRIKVDGVLQCPVSLTP